MWGLIRRVPGRGLASAPGTPTKPVQSSSSEHWYTMDGRAYVPTSPSGRRPTTATAIKLGLVPSTTTILGIVHKRNLDYWRLSNMIQATAEVHERMLAAYQERGRPPLEAQAPVDLDDQMLLLSAVHGGSVPDESIAAKSPEMVEQLTNEVLSGSVPAEVPPSISESDRKYFLSASTALYLERTSKAASTGSRVHHLIEAELLHISAGKPSPAWPSELYVVRDQLRRWVDERCQTIERVEAGFASRYGFGGRIDLLFKDKSGERSVCDFKTQSSRTGRIVFHHEWASQLAAYAVGTDRPDAPLVNLVFNVGGSTGHGDMVERTWSRGEDNREYWDAFVVAHRLWSGPLGRRVDFGKHPAELLALPSDWETVRQKAAEGTCTIANA